MQISISSTETNKAANSSAKSKTWHSALSFLHFLSPLIPPCPLIPLNRSLSHIYRSHACLPRTMLHGFDTSDCMQILMLASYAPDSP